MHETLNPYASLHPNSLHLRGGGGWGGDGVGEIQPETRNPKPKTLDPQRGVEGYVPGVGVNCPLTF